jgi:hypothetical protein
MCALSRLKSLLAGAVLAWGVASGAAATAAPTMADAQQAYYQGQYGRSLALFMRLAEAQDAEAAESAGFMLLLGEPQYGAQVRRNVPRAKALLLQAARAGRAGAGAMLNLLERSD